MKPVSPVIPHANLPEVIVAEHQDEYQNLPSIVLEGGIILCRWKMTDEEKAIVAHTGDVYLYQWRGENPVTPMLLQVETPIVGEAENYADDVLQSEMIETESARLSVEIKQPAQTKYRIRCSFDAAPFQWGMEDGVFKDDVVVERAGADHPPEARSEMYPGYLKADEHHFGGGGIAHSGFEPYVETHKGKFRIDSGIWIVTNPSGEKEIYDAEAFHQIYATEI